jgi:hypothetical protein
METIYEKQCETGGFREKRKKEEPAAERGLLFIQTQTERERERKGEQIKVFK